MIDFSGEKPVYMSDATPKCIGCHGYQKDPGGMKHIWDSYPHWPGVYGSKHNMSPIVIGNGRGLKPHLFEKEGLRNFLRHKEGKGRYAYIDLVSLTTFRAFTLDTWIIF